MLFYKVEKDGEYLLEIRDILHRSKHEFVYRLRIGALPYLTHVFPLGGPRNAAAKIELHGVNLAQESLDLPIPGQSPALHYMSVSHNGLTSNALPLAAGDLPEVRETEPNDSPAQANRVTVPVTINGRIQQAGDADWFVFKAEAGKKLVMQVEARRLDSPLDSILTLFDASGKATGGERRPETTGAVRRPQRHGRSPGCPARPTRPIPASRTRSLRRVITFCGSGTCRRRAATSMPTG